MNCPFTNEDRQRGYKQMEKSLSPLVKALRRFTAGRPSGNLNNTPLGAVALLTEQRKRLEEFLAKEKVKGAQITSQAVVIRFDPPTKRGLADVVLVQQGKEGEALQLLSDYGAKFKLKFVIAGVMFAVKDTEGKVPFAYPIERTPEGKAALQYAWDRQMQPRKSGNYMA